MRKEAKIKTHGRESKTFLRAEAPTVLCCALIFTRASFSFEREGEEYTHLNIIWDGRKQQ